MKSTKLKFERISVTFHFELDLQRKGKKEQGDIAITSEFKIKNKFIYLGFSIYDMKPLSIDYSNDRLQGNLKWFISRQIENCDDEVAEKDVIENYGYVKFVRSYLDTCMLYFCKPIEQGFCMLINVYGNEENFEELFALGTHLINNAVVNT